MKVERGKRGKQSKRKKKKRVGFHLDMTPLVDITFLLLTFFMFTTTMAQPQIMEMTIPPEIKQEIEVRASELMEIFVREDDQVFWRVGEDEPEPVKIDQIEKLAIRENLKPEVKNKLITAVKVSPEATYSLIIEILDELNLAETTITQEITKETDPETGQTKKRERRFTIAELTENEKEMISEEAMSQKEE
ncbi:MAG: ExbD/TolR family protein [Candidatus Kapaibacterium sp.]